MTKEQILYYSQMMAKLQNALQESNLDAKWKGIAIDMAKTSAIMLETKFLIDGGSLR